MVARNFLILLCVSLAVIGCKYFPKGKARNLYDTIIKPIELNEKDLSVIKTDGYYYKTFKNIEGNEFITVFILFKNGYSISTSYRFEKFQDFEDYLLSDYFFDVVSVIDPSVFNIDSGSMKLIVQWNPIGGDTFQHHIPTLVYDIKSENELILTDRFEIHYKKVEEIYNYKEFSAINVLFNKLLKNGYFSGK